MWKPFFVELNLIKRYLLKVGNITWAKKKTIKIHRQMQSRNLTLYFSCYYNILLLGYFDAGMGEVIMSNVCSTYDLKSLTTDSTGDSPTVTGLLQTNFPLCFLVYLRKVFLIST